MKFPNRPRLQFQKILKASGWKYIGPGRHREVWHRGNYVIKIPLCMNGLSDNFHERSVWSKHRDHGYIKYASCRMVGNFLLLMEYARFVGPDSDETGYFTYSKSPEWGYSIDCGQIGYNKRGRIVAYDYGLT